MTKIACSTSVATKKSLEEALAFIASLGFSHVDILAHHGWAHLNPHELVSEPQKVVTELVGTLRRFGLKAAAINASLSSDFGTREEAKVEQNLAEIRGLIRFAREIDTRIVVIQPGVKQKAKKAGEDAFQASASFLQAAEPIAKNKGVTLAIEAHVGSLAERYEDALRFVSVVPGLKIAYDPSHFVMSGLDLESSKLLLSNTAHVHLRNAVKGNFQAPMDKGDLDFMWVMEALDSAGYSGSIAIEYLDNRDEDILQDIIALKSLLETRYHRLFEPQFDID